VKIDWSQFGNQSIQPSAVTRPGPSSSNNVLLGLGQPKIPKYKLLFS
jgi:hypothetical protein